VALADPEGSVIMDEMGLKSIEQYQSYLWQKLASWTPPRPLALAASFAERWMRAYEEFSHREEWGDPEALRMGVETVWGHVLGKSSSASERKRLIRAIEQASPHMDDFDAIEALMTCVVVNDALSACADPKKAATAVWDMATEVLENLSEEEWPEEPEERTEFWESDVIQDELRAQLRLIELVEAVKSFEELTVNKLRRQARNLVVIIRPTPPASGVTNAEIFERYRDQVERHLVEQEPPEEDPAGDSHMTAMSYFGAWLSRYMTRLRMVNGEWGRLRDQVGAAALLAKNRAADAAVGDAPDWDEKAEEMLGMCLKNNERAGTVDVGDLVKPHAYGPSLRSLWLEGRRRGNADGWRRIGEWARSRPQSWTREESAAQSTEDLRRALTRQVEWNLAGDPKRPWMIDVDGQRWMVCLNDFPDEPMYGLIIDGRRVGDFHDWPDTWIRPADLC
jgi:uncharacterized protein YjaG (DUF416 family)